MKKSDNKKYSGFFRGMLDGLRMTVSQPTPGSKSDHEFDGLRSTMSQPSSGSKSDEEFEGLRSTVGQTASTSKSDHELDGLRSTVSQPSTESKSDYEFEGLRSRGSHSSEESKSEPELNVEETFKETFRDHSEEEEETEERDNTSTPVERKRHEDQDENYQIAKIVIDHGFPYQPTALAFDPIKRLIAIGTKNGSLRILGRPGFEIHIRHTTEYAVLKIIFLINEGSLITLCADDSLYLWNFRSKPPEIVQTLKFQKERITYSHLTFQSKWLYIGTERGNVYFVNIETFVLSGYLINWNKAIDFSTRKTHPGAIVHLSDCPIDSNKLLLGFESACIVLWDLRNRSADFRVYHSEILKSISWHHEGRQFLCSHTDGSLTTWNIKGGTKPVSTIYPHSKSGNDLEPEPELCKPIYKAEWRTVRDGESYIIFSGGLPMGSGHSGSEASPQPQTPSQPSPSSSSAPPVLTPSQLYKTFDKSNGTQTLTVIHGKTTQVLEMEDNIIDFITLCETPYEMEFSDPYAIVVLLQNDLVVVDLLSFGALFTSAKELPEPPKPTFLKSLFGGGTVFVDRDELFNESNAGKPSKTIAKHIPGPSMEQMKAQAGTFAGDMAKLREGVSERGEKLGHLEDRTERMKSEAEAFSSASHQVMLKYRDKKWYQF